MTNLRMNQFYLWKKRSSCRYPWQRQWNTEFLKYEQKRIKDVTKWYMNFQKSKVGQDLEEVYYYAVPIKLNSRWKVAIAPKEGYTYTCLSALKNCPQWPLLMLIPKDKIPPKDYSLLRVIKSKKDCIHDKKNNEVQYVIIGEEFEEVDPSYVYIDVPFEKRSVSKFIKENLVDDDLIANSFQPTISGSPYVINRKGGISLSTFFLRPNSCFFSDELIKTLKLMQPPEFTDLQFKLPPKLVKGKQVSLSRGIKFQVGERATIGRNFFTAFSSNYYDKLNDELIKRDTFRGEYSIACSLTPRGKASELLRDILSKFVKTEIMHPFNTEELKYWDIDLSIIQKNIGEDLWLQVANQKQINPTVVNESPEVIKLRQSLIPEWKAILDSLGLKKNIEHGARVYSQASFNNILRVAQSIARDEQSNQVNELILKKSFKLFVENADSLINNPIIQKYAKVVIPGMYESDKLNAVRVGLSVNLLDIKELFNNVKEFFKDIYELQEYIDKKLLPGGCIYEPKRGFYKWI